MSLTPAATRRPRNTAAARRSSSLAPVQSADVGRLHRHARMDAHVRRIGGAVRGGHLRRQRGGVEIVPLGVGAGVALPVRDIERSPHAGLAQPGLGGGVGRHQADDCEPSSALMLDSVMRSCMDSARTASPQNSTAW